MSVPTTVIFDLGNVLISHDARWLYRKVFDGDEAGMDRFLAEVCTPAWNAEQDRGRTWAEGTAELLARHPELREPIEAYSARWNEMIGGPIEGTVEILRELKDGGVRLLALTNWSQETFPWAREHFDFLDWFEGIVVSGEERLVKPDPLIFELIRDRYDLDPAASLFVDDMAVNIEAAAALGFATAQFSDPDLLRAELTALGLLARS